MGAYDYFKCVMTVFVFILGIVIFVFPEKSTKKEERNDKNAVAATKKKGLILMVLGFVLTVLLIVVNLI